MRQICYLPYILSGIFILNSAAQADERSYVWTYQYQTMEPGAAEIEHYMTLTTPYADSISGTMSVEHQLELEVGMTERYDFSIYQVFGQKPGESFKYKAFKLRSRYRTGELGGDLIRPILYFEYKANQDFTEQKVEFKPIVGNTFDRIEVAINPKIEWEKKNKAEYLWGYAAALGYKVSPMFGFGLEFTGSESGHYFGPTISHGGHNLWMALGSGFALGSVDADKPEMQIRLLIGIGIAKPEKDRMRPDNAGLPIR